jgi:futalosine hydrolase
MEKKILIVAATPAEAEVIGRIQEIGRTGNDFVFRNSEITLLITGVGSAATSWGMSKWISANPKPDLAINIGISGSYRKDIGIGEVVVIQSDCFADAGIENDGEFETLGEAGLSDPDMFPFKNGSIIAEDRYLKLAGTFMKKVKAITVNTATGSEATRDKLLKKFNPDIETMEGATFFYICCGEKIPFLAIRAVSNYVEPRNRGKWNIPLALGSLSEKLTELFLMLE